jgi:glycosyltransferase involved in cell wall biosynthesis
MPNRYAIITPAHNEGRFLPQVIAGIAAQILPPVHWIILDDRSTDDTWDILTAASARYAFLEPMRVTGPAGRRVGPNVVHLFNQGLAQLADNIDFVVKMDADVILPCHYFAELLARFATDPHLGLASGKTYTWQQGAWVLERIADSHVTGACKTYRLTCLRDMGGLIPVLGWDVLDVVQARRRGWGALSFRDLPIYHLRLSGSAQGLLRANLSYGRSYYAMRAHPLFVLAKALYRALERPYGLGLFIVAGYLGAALRQEKRLSDLGLATYLRQEQLARLQGRTLKQEELLPRRWHKFAWGKNAPEESKAQT